MEIFLKKMAEQYDGTFQVDESTWYNGHGYMPLFIYTLEFNENNLKVKFEYEFRKSEFKNATAIDGGTFGDRHIFEFTATNSEKGFPNFIVEEVSFFKRIFLKNKLPFHIKCESKEFINSILNNHNLKEMMRFMSIDPEFSPTIYGKTDKNIYNLKILFLTKKVQYDLLEHSFQFLTIFK
jgi:hypothetical protein